MNPLLVGPLIDIAGKLLDRVLPNAEAREAAKQKLAESALAGELAQLERDFTLTMAQIETNRAEAGHQSIFVAGWRPAIGWVCVAGLGWHYIGFPIATWYISSFLPGVSPPVSIETSLVELTVGLLGLAGLRTFEKVKGAR